MARPTKFLMASCWLRRNVALGVVPLGSGNLLASDLGLPSDPVEAAKKLLTYQPREFRPGLVCSQGVNGPEKRYFLVAAGVGADAELMYRTEVEAKEFWGRNAYFLEMARMALSRRYPMFHVEWEDEQGNRQQGEAMLAMCVRAGKFPGLLSRVKLGTRLCAMIFACCCFGPTKSGASSHTLPAWRRGATGKLKAWMPSIQSGFAARPFRACAPCTPRPMASCWAYCRRS